MTYGRRAFAEAYLLARASDDDPVGEYQQERSAYNNALREHRLRMLAGLETLFGLRLDMAAVASAPGGPALFMLFNSTVRACLASRTPGGSFLEAGLLYRTLAEAGEAGTRVLATLDRITQLSDAWREAHLDVLDELLGILLGEWGGLVFTSADLLAAGVEDTPPVSTDYPWDMDE